MKKHYLLLIFVLFIVSVARSQEFAKDIAAAKASYASGNLADAHFSLEQGSRSWI